jgi:hypothetical protein
MSVQGFPSANPIPVSKFDEVYELRSRHYALAQPSREIARVLWTVSDKELAQYVDRWPSEVLREAAGRKRVAVFPTIKELMERPGVNEGAMKTLVTWARYVPQSRVLLTATLDSKERGERSLAALLLAQQDDLTKAEFGPVIRRLREIIDNDRDPVHLLAAAQALAKVDGNHALPYARRAHVRATGPQSNSAEERRLWQGFVIVRGSLRDRSVLPTLRRYATQRSDPHLAVRAVDTLALAFGASERKTLETALSGLAAARLQSALWLAHFGDRRSVPALEHAAKSPPLDVKNSGGFATINDKLLEVAAGLKRGEQGDLPRIVPTRIALGQWSTAP